HRSAKPTLTIDAKKNTWTCTGTCKVNDATVIDWTMRAEGISRKHAIELLRSGSTGASPTAKKPPKTGTARRLDTFAAMEEPDAAVLNRVADYYHARLRENPDALAFVKELGLRAEVVEHFRVGFSDRSLGYRLPEKNRKTGKLLRGQLTRLGILRATGHEHF